jgi:hypothetical protein
MNESTEPQKPIPFDGPACLKALRELTALVEALQKQREENSAPVSVTEPTTVTSRFTSASGEFHRALKKFAEEMKGFLAHAPMNQKFLILVGTFKRNAEIFQANLEANVLDIAQEIQSWNVESREPDDERPDGQS